MTLKNSRASLCCVDEDVLTMQASIPFSRVWVPVPDLWTQSAALRGRESGDGWISTVTADSDTVHFQLCRKKILSQKQLVQNRRTLVSELSQLSPE